MNKEKQNSEDRDSSIPPDHLDLVLKASILCTILSRSRMFWASET
ncbi:hypothetical protein T11_85 [Trichinella zimbabwensis]|uniref:Uncharacterized protein n=1 Tax=Trichinella zimbabwensis TaxID=268475 RepID=A0A0V1GEJ6_9BILA|nr:hypothetical protein T11_85 [Trichinella zimbabwensis]